MKAVLTLIVLTLIPLVDCIEKRQCSCPNARQFAASTCEGITDFENLFTLSGSTITSFGSVLDRIAVRSDRRSVINEICTSVNCFSRLETLYSCCTVDNSGGNGLTSSFSDVARNFACNRPSPSTDYCATDITDATTIIDDCNNQCSSRCRVALIQMQSCCVISYYQLLTNETQQRILTQDIWSTCGIPAPSKCTNPLCFSPTFTTIGQDAIVGNGGVHTVTCRAEGEGQIRYELLKEETEAFGFQLDGTFNFENVNGNDGGRYRCIARNQCGTVQSDNFTIYVQPRMTIVSFSNTTLIDTEQIDLQCTGNGYPEPLVQWVLNGTVIKNGSQLLITNLTVSDTAVYYCIGSVMVGSAILTANDSISITVVPAPILPTSTVEVLVTRTCIMMTVSDNTVATVQSSFVPNDTDRDETEELTVTLAITCVVTFIITLVVTALTTCIITSLYYRHRYELKKKVKVDVDDTKQSIIMDTNPAYATTDHDTIKMDVNPSYSAVT